jgi:hypothetical protein
MIMEEEMMIMEEEMMIMDKEVTNVRGRRTHTVC